MSEYITSNKRAASIQTYQFTKQNWYDIACIIDNEFNGSFKTFTHNLHIQDSQYFISLTTNRCDWSSLIRCYILAGNINSIRRLGEDTEGYQFIQRGTVERVNKHLLSIQAVPIP